MVKKNEKKMQNLNGKEKCKKKSYNNFNRSKFRTQTLTR